MISKLLLLLLLVGIFSLCVGLQYGILIGWIHNSSTIEKSDRFIKGDLILMASFFDISVPLNAHKAEIEILVREVAKCGHIPLVPQSNPISRQECQYKAILQKPKFDPIPTFLLSTILYKFVLCFCSKLSSCNCMLNGIVQFWKFRNTISFLSIFPLKQRSTAIWLHPQRSARQSRTNLSFSAHHSARCGHLCRDVATYRMHNAGGGDVNPPLLQKDTLPAVDVHFEVWVHPTWTKFLR